ncbi:MAG: right-handed parallel beta-helix repeat-containing protein [Sneathiellales bacterium]|nr:right-handed parallel beta-helix repeat-containing protein [Sneathiellales bacterium]
MGETVTVSSVEQLLDILSGDVSGMTIKLAPGDYTDFKIDINPSSTVTITSADLDNPARISGLNIGGASNIDFENLRFEANETDALSLNWGRYVVRVDNSSDINFGNSDFGGVTENMMHENIIALYVDDSQDIGVTGSDFHNIYKGAIFSHSDDIVASGNTLHDIRSDGFDFIGVQGVLIEKNSFSDFYHNDVDHSDYIQFWSTGATRQSTDVVIRDNFMVQGDGLDAQAIFIRDGDGLGYTNFTIENNLIYQSGYHGISVGGVDGLTIRGNTVLSTVEQGKPTWISVNSSDNYVIENNIASKLDYEESHNFSVEGNIVAPLGGDYGEYFEGLFGDPLTPNTTSFDDFIVDPTLNAGADMNALIMQNDNLVGNAENNFIEGTDDDDLIIGFMGRDTLVGGDGDDTLSGGWDADELKGGAGADVFEFSQINDSSADSASHDKILDFQVGDKISFEGLVDGSLTYIGSQDFSGHTYTAFDQHLGLEAAAAKLGDGIVNMGRDASMQGMDDFTISVTFEANSLDGGYQALLWSHTQYNIVLDDDLLKVGIRNTDGGMSYVKIPGAIDETGWHDVQMQLDSSANSLKIFVDGAEAYSGTADHLELTPAGSWDVTAGGTPWGSNLDGQVADVTILDEIVDIEQNANVYDRMVNLDSHDDYFAIDHSTGDAQVRYDEDTNMLYADLNGDQKVDMKLELVGVEEKDLDDSSFLF